MWYQIAEFDMDDYAGHSAYGSSVTHWHMDFAIECPTLSFNSNYLQNGLMEFDLVCGH